MECEINFCNECLNISLVGMSSNIMIEYVKFCCDRLLIQLGYDKFYNISNPLDFMELQGVSSQTNFFESRSAEYSLPSESAKFSLNDEF